MTQPADPLEDLKRTIVLLYGMMEGNAPFWLFAAVRPSRYQQFMSAHKEGKIDLRQFEPYGELIICGEGKSPPDDVILKVAEMYQSDPSTFAKAVQDSPNS